MNNYCLISSASVCVVLLREESTGFIDIQIYPFLEMSHVCFFEAKFGNDSGDHL